jgi:hypothetical protein
MRSPEQASNWVAVASANHVALGCELGIMQVGHGKGAPLRRLRAGDRVAYYSPVRRFGTKEACQAFTAVGLVRDERVYQADMGEGFVPFRRDVDYLPAHEASIQPLLDSLSFTRGARSWGYAFRFGLLKVGDEDMALIARAMQADLSALSLTQAAA